MTIGNCPLKQISIPKGDILKWNDIIYLFSHIRRGKGFDPLDISSDLSQTIQEFYYKYPFLFTLGKRGNLYPSKMGFELGRKVNAYLRINRLPDSFIIDQYDIKIKL
jgi:hypothetical protein